MSHVSCFSWPFSSATRITSTHSDRRVTPSPVPLHVSVRRCRVQKEQLLARVLGIAVAGGAEAIDDR